MINYSTLTTLFPKQEFTTSEMVEIATCFNNSAVKKYLHHIATQAIEGIVFGGPSATESSESFLRRQAVVTGGLGAIEQLLQIEPPVKTA